MRVHQLCRDDVSMWLQLQVDGVELLTDSNSTASNYNITRPLIIFRLQETDNLLAKNIVSIVSRIYLLLFLLTLKYKMHYNWPDRRDNRTHHRIE